MSDETMAATPSTRQEKKPAETMAARPAARPASGAGADTMVGESSGTRTEEDATQRFGRYRVLEPLGEGGMGAVFAAHDDALGRDVAVKSIRVPRGVTEDGRAMLIERFEREGKALASLSHPNVVRVHDVGREAGAPFLVMERVRGPSLRERVQRGPLSARDAMTLGVQLAAALEAAHAAGIVHRDVKPGNVLEGQGGWILADFGVARLPRSQLTMVGQFLGTPGYASPEALLEGEFSAASDMYAWGATMFHALAGRAPHGERGVETVVESQKAGPPALPPSIRRALPPVLASSIHATMSADPSARPSARSVRERLEHAGPRARLPVIALAALGGITFIAGAILGLIVGLSASSSDEPAVNTPVIAPTVTQPAPRSPENRRSDADRYRRWQEIAADVNGGNHARGRQRLEELLEIYPDDEPARELLDRLDQYDEADDEW